jgi:hypothetical protein
MTSIRISGNAEECRTKSGNPEERITEAQETDRANAGNNRGEADSTGIYTHSNRGRELKRSRTAVSAHAGCCCTPLAEINIRARGTRIFDATGCISDVGVHPQAVLSILITSSPVAIVRRLAGVRAISMAVQEFGNCHWSSRPEPLVPGLISATVCHQNQNGNHGSEVITVFGRSGFQKHLLTTC